MAPKKKKKKEYYNDLREVVIKHYLNGDSESEIAQKTLISRDSVHYMVEKYKSTKCIGNIIGRGRKRKTTAHTDRVIQRKIKVDRRKSASTIKAEFNIAISETTISRRVHEIGLYGRVARKETYANKINHWKCPEYARTYREKQGGKLIRAFLAIPSDSYTFRSIPTLKKSFVRKRFGITILFLA
ncbi:unnamed protein product [Rotaria socialis]|uniref:Transposase Tc1-like domain-containing protein n=1 Tax=Rotaria socialis TaxID=392032 RepID=A0A818M7T9_9BILA|nr:unnamed protein product [Rotaria socialis]CAF3665406.1 unnamed protein product [Rotaria socialis]CAF4594935.1 unnamed protein product [Rotaria socialis]CAF4730699.1 unnamed protein product [Rotaria socialis]CAF4824780.1 unnamed protein product [Rotaria socialis]